VVYLLSVQRGQEYEARRARALQKQLRTRQANERRYRAAIYEKEQRRLRRLRLETSRRSVRHVEDGSTREIVLVDR
jgi:hypothetical protein